MTTDALQSGKPAEAIEHLYALEKQTRQVQFPLTTVHSLTPLPGGDAISTAKVATAIIDICHDNKDLKGVLNHLQVLSKRRGQLKQVRFSDLVPVSADVCRQLLRLYSGR